MGNGDDVKWNYLFEGRRYELGSDNNSVCTREYRHEIHKGEIVTMSREVNSGDSTPWSYTTINGDGYLQNADGTFVK